MNRNEQELYNNIKRIAIALENIANKKDTKRSSRKWKGFRPLILTKAANRVK